MIFIGFTPTLFFTANNLSNPPNPKTHGHYSVLTCKVDGPPPFQSVDFVYGHYNGW